MQQEISMAPGSWHEFQEEVGRAWGIQREVHVQYGIMHLQYLFVPGVAGLEKAEQVSWIKTIPGQQMSAAHRGQ